MYALTAVKGIGPRFADIVLKKANIDRNKRAGECTEEEVERITTVLMMPIQYKIPTWFLNRQKDVADGKSTQVRFLIFTLLRGVRKNFKFLGFSLKACTIKTATVCKLYLL